MRNALLMVLICLTGPGCQCGGGLGFSLRLTGPSEMLRTAPARFQVSVLDDQGRSAPGTVTVQSDRGSLREGASGLVPDGSARVELSCAPSQDPDCAGEVVTLVATWRDQRVEHQVRLVDAFGTSGTGGGFAMTGGGTSGGTSGGSAGGPGTADGGACTQGMGLSSLGCEFLATAVPPEVSTKGSCYAVVLANGSSQTVDVRVERDGQVLAPSFVQLVSSGSGAAPTYTVAATVGGVALLPANQVAVLFLAEGGASSGPMRIACPMPAAVSKDYQLLGSTTLPAFRISTSGPVAAYDIYPYGGARSFVASASLLLPTTSWGTTSVAITPAPPLGPYNSFVQIFADEDNTELSIEAPVAIVGGMGVAPSAARRVVPRLLQRGQVMQLDQTQELGGSTIRSNKRVAVWGGHTCMNVPTGVPACDSAHQQLPPVANLGSEYVAVRPPSRTAASEDALWRLVGTTAGTRLTYTPRVSNAPSQLGPGQVAEFAAPGPFVVRAQDELHPFLATQLMTGAGRVSQAVGDPDFVLLVPPGQFLSSYLFFTDHTYENTHLVFVRRKTPSGSFAEVMLDCGTATLSWLPTGDPKFEYAIRSWRKGDSSGQGVGGGGCTNGIRRATSAEPFGLTVWGTDTYVSYAYPAGMGVNQLNTVDPDPIE